MLTTRRVVRLDEFTWCIIPSIRRIYILNDTLIVLEGIIINHYKSKNTTALFVNSPAEVPVLGV
jgi:hypothetical protein